MKAAMLRHRRRPATQGVPDHDAGPGHRNLAQMRKRISDLARALVACLGITGAGAAGLQAQIGDQPNEVQPPPSADLNIPPAPLLTPEQALGSFVLPPGFRIELVAAEPLVHDPVFVRFDTRGRMWVAEFESYNIEILTLLPVYLEKGERPPQPVGRIVMLEDTNGDGRMDKRTVFLDNLKAPKGVGFWRDQVLVMDSPNIWLCRDTNGDGVADEKTLLSGGDGEPHASQGGPNGLLWARDNWLYNASDDGRLRFVGGKWVREPMFPVGQWGIAQDDFGRLYFNHNSDQLRAGLVPPHYLARDGAAGLLGDANARIAADQNVWPVRPTPGVNRGYQTGFLRTDGTLVSYTASAGPTLYRGSNFPDRYAGNAFVPDASSNIVKRSVLREVEGRVEAVNGFEQTDFLGSMDEWFRPVFTTNAPDGALYVVDMHRGMIEGYQFITSYLRDQILQRGLNRQLSGLGRIYRVVYTGRPLAGPVNFETASPEALVALLDHANGWTRDEAQRVIVQSGQGDALVPRLRDALQRGAGERRRIYALWCLEGLGAFTAQDFAAALRDPHPQVRIGALRAGEAMLARPEGGLLLRQLAAGVAAEDPHVLAQLALSLDGNTAALARDIERLMLVRGAEHPALLEAVLFLGRNHYADVLTHLVTVARGDARPLFGGRTLFAALATRIALRNDDGGHAALAAAVADATVPAWARLALMEGIAQPGLRATRATLRLQISSRHLAAIAASAPDALVRRQAAPIAASLRAAEEQRARQALVAPLSAAQQRLFVAGRATYTLCAACHQADGLGREALAPPLKDGRWATAADPGAAIRIVLHGKQGTPAYPGAMAPLASLSDHQIASVLTYVRRSFGNQGSAVSTQDVARVRSQTGARQAAWTDAELEGPLAPGRGER